MDLSGETVEFEGVYRILDEMVWNLCENAVKYNKPGGRVHVWVGSTLSGPKIIVKDTGIGIPEEEQERIFERFYRVDKKPLQGDRGNRAWAFYRQAWSGYTQYSDPD